MRAADTPSPLFAPFVELETAAPEHELLAGVARAAADLVPSSIAWLWLFREDRLELGAAEGIADAGRWPARTTFGLGEGLVGHVAATRQPLVVHDAQGDPRTIDAGFFRAAGLPTFVGLPLLAHYRLEGVLAIGARGPAPGAEALAHLAALASRAALAVERARLYAESERRRRAAEALVAVARTLAGSLDFPEVAASIVRSVIVLLGGVSAGLRRLMPDGSLVSVARAGARQDHFERGHVMAPGRGVGGRAVAESRAVASPDMLADPGIVVDGDLRARVGGSGLSAVLAAPLRAKGVILGTLAVADTAGRTFSAEERTLLQAVADQAAVALESARLYEETERRRRVAETLAEVGRALSQSLHVPDVARRVLANVARLFGGTQAAIYRVDLASGALRLLAGAGTPEWSDVLARGTGTVGLAVQRRGPVTTADVVTDPQIQLDDALRAAIEGWPSRAVLAVPLLVQGQVIGALGIGDRTGRLFDEDEIALAQLFADRAAIALDNARLYEEADRQRHEAERTAALVELLKAVAVAANEAPTVDAALEGTLDRVCAYTGWPVGHAFLRAEAGGEMRSSGVWRLPAGAAFEAFRAASAAAGPVAGEGLVGRVLATRRPMWLASIGGLPALQCGPAAAAAGLGFAFAFPVLVRAEVAAILEFFSPAPAAPDERLQEAVAQIGAQLGRVIERERAAAALRRSEERYRALVTNIPDVAWLADRRGHTVFLSPHVERVLGFTADEVYRGGTALWRGRIHPDDRARVTTHYAALFERGARFDLEYRVQRRDGRWVWLHDRAVALYEQHGASYAYGLFSDITERKQAAEIRALLLNQVITVQEEERRRIARELHDETAQSLASLLLGLSALQDARTLAAARRQARELHQVAGRALTEVRRLAWGLRPSVLDDLGLGPALERYATDYGSARGMTVEVDVGGLQGTRVPPPVETALYRIMQEALTNVARHARARTVRVVVGRQTEAVTMTIADDGCGFDASEALGAPGPERGLGLHTMRERAAVLGGSLAIEAAPGRGARVVVDIPLPGAAA